MPFLCWAVRQRVFPASGGSDFRLTQPFLVYIYSISESWWAREFESPELFGQYETDSE